MARREFAADCCACRYVIRVHEDNDISFSSFRKQPLDRKRLTSRQEGSSQKARGKSEFAILLRLQFRILEVAEEVLDAQHSLPREDNVPARREDSDAAPVACAQNRALKRP